MHLAQPVALSNVQIIQGSVVGSRVAQDGVLWQDHVNRQASFDIFYHLAHNRRAAKVAAPENS